jgi:hypothetical protein
MPRAWSAPSAPGRHAAGRRRGSCRPRTRINGSLLRRRGTALTGALRQLAAGELRAAAQRGPLLRALLRALLVEAALATATRAEATLLHLATPWGGSGG